MLKLTSFGMAPTCLKRDGQASLFGAALYRLGHLASSGRLMNLEKAAQSSMAYSTPPIF
jgi:hypothetical protein